MKQNQYTRLENDTRFKQRYLPPFFWLKHFSLLPPCLLLFFSLFGLLYLFNLNMELTYYAIPFVLIFCVATVWLKALKKIIIQKEFLKEGSFLICLAKSVAQDGKLIHAAFSVGSKRHETYHIDQFFKNNENVKFPIKTGQAIVWSNNEESVRLISFLEADIRKKCLWKSIGDSFAVFFVDDKTVSIVSTRELNKKK